MDKCKCFGYGIRFDRHGIFSFNKGIGRYVITFGADMSSSAKIDNRKKGILIFGTFPTQGLEDTLSAENIYTNNFARRNEKFCLSLHYDGANRYFFVNGKDIHKFKVKDSEIIATILCLENISKDWSVDNMKKDWIKWLCL